MIKHDNAKDTDEIWTVDAQGNFELFWTVPDVTTDIVYNLYYHEKYLYACVWEKSADGRSEKIIRNSTTDGKTETRRKQSTNRNITR